MWHLFYRQDLVIQSITKFLCHYLRIEKKLTESVPVTYKYRKCHLYKRIDQSHFITYKRGAKPLSYYKFFRTITLRNWYYLIDFTTWSFVLFFKKIICFRGITANRSSCNTIFIENDDTNCVADKNY